MSLKKEGLQKAVPLDICESCLHSPDDTVELWEFYQPDLVFKGCEHEYRKWTKQALERAQEK